jgi:hypothetical protein
MSYTPVFLDLSPHPDSAYQNGQWAGSHSYNEDSYPITNTSYVAPTAATGLYTLWYNTNGFALNGSYSSGHHIYFDFNTNTWNDGESTFAPHALTNTSTYANTTSCGDGEYIYVWASSTECRGRFLSPYWSGGGGPGTLSVVSTGWTYEVPAGVTPVEVPGRELFLNIAASAPTDTYKIYHDGLYHSNVIHTTGTVSSVQDSNDACEYVLYRGTVHTSSSLNTIVATWSRPCNKVFCNFW